MTTSSDSLKMNKKPAELSLRLINYMIDSLLIALLSGPASMIFSVLQGNFDSNAGIFGVFALIQFLYYFIFEVSSGQTIGKKITKTKVIPVHGKLSFLKLFIRTITRLIWFDKISYLFGHITGMHDQYSNTYVIKIKAE